MQLTVGERPTHRPPPILLHLKWGFGQLHFYNLDADQAGVELGVVEMEMLQGILL